MSECYPWYPMYAKDWLTSRKVRRLTWAQQGIYKRLLDEEWDGGALEGDAQQIAGDIGAPVDDVAVVLESCFFLAVNGWVNERLEEIRAEQLAKSEALAQAGRKGGKAAHRNKIEAPSQAQARPKPGSSNRTEQSRAESEQITPPSVEASERKAKRKTALPTDWRPNEGHHSQAKRDGLNAESEAEQFRDHHTAKGSVMLDWDAAFRTWLRNAKKFAERDAKAGRPKADNDAAQVLLARQAEGWAERKRATEEAIARDLAKRQTAPPIANDPSGPLAGLVARVMPKAG